MPAHTVRLPVSVSAISLGKRLSRSKPKSKKRLATAWLVIFPMVFGVSFGLAYWVANQLMPDGASIVRETPEVSVARAANNMMLSIREHNQQCHPSELAQLPPEEIKERLDQADELFGEARGHFALLEIAAGEIETNGEGFSPVLNGHLRTVERKLVDYGQVAVAQASLIKRQLTASDPETRLAPSVYLAAIYDGFQQRRTALTNVHMPTMIC